MLFGWKFLPQSIGTYADELDNLFWLISAMMGVCLIITAVVIFGLLFMYRRKPGVKAEYLGGDTKKQLSFIYITLFIFVLIDLVIDIENHAVWAKVKENLPAAQMTVKGVGQQWAWSFTHPGQDGTLGTEDDIVAINELHIVAGKLVHVELESSDVLHSFSLPEFRLKQDVIPGRIITSWFQSLSFEEVKAAKATMIEHAGAELLGADDAGYATFDIQCTEMCGVGHGIMAAKIFIHNAESYNNWVSENAPIIEEAAE